MISREKLNNLAIVELPKDACESMVNILEPRTGDGATLQVFLTAPLRNVDCKSLRCAVLSLPLHSHNNI